MPQGRLAFIALVIAFGLLWRPFLQPAGQGAVLILDLFAPLIGVNLAQVVSPEPRVEETVADLAGTATRITWWRPGHGDSHAGVMMVNGATADGNANPATRQLGVALARAGFLAMLPEFGFLKAGRFDTGATAQLDSALEHLRQRPENAGKTAGAFGASVGGGALLAAAGSEPWVRGADYVVVLGAYYDLATYLASVVSRSQLRGGEIVPWAPSAEALERLPAGVIAAVAPREQEDVRAATIADSYEAALARIRALPSGSRAVFDALSPETVWGSIAPPVFWLHDPNDTYEPVAEAEAAAAAPRQGRFTLIVPGLIQHAEVSKGSGDRGPFEVVRELASLLGAIIEIMRLAR